MIYGIVRTHIEQLVQWGVLSPCHCNGCRDFLRMFDYGLNEPCMDACILD